MPTIEQCRAVEDDWDGEGAKRPTAWSLDAAEALLRRIEGDPTLPRLYPALHCDGWVGVEGWKDKDLISLEFDPPGMVWWYTSKGDDKSRDGVLPLPSQDDALVAIIREWAT